MTALIVQLPEGLKEGLNESQINLMSSTVTSVTASFKVAGNAIRATAEELARLKSVLPNGTWIKFLKSGVLPIGERTARDLVKAYTWMAGQDLSDQDCESDARSMSHIASADEVRKRSLRN